MRLGRRGHIWKIKLPFVSQTVADNMSAQEGREEEGLQGSTTETRRKRYRCKAVRVLCDCSKKGDGKASDKDRWTTMYSHGCRSCGSECSQ